VAVCIRQYTVDFISEPVYVGTAIAIVFHVGKKLFMVFL
jgi:hypothetical protein